MGCRKQAARWYPTISKIRLSVNGLNAPIKRQTVRLSEKSRTQFQVMCKKSTLNIMAGNKKMWYEEANCNVHNKL